MLWAVLSPRLWRTQRIAMEMFCTEITLLFSEFFSITGQNSLVISINSSNSQNSDNDFDSEVCNWYRRNAHTASSALPSIPQSRSAGLTTVCLAPIENELEQPAHFVPVESLAFWEVDWIYFSSMSSQVEQSFSNGTVPLKLDSVTL